MAGLASVDNKFPIYLWCWIVKQAEITISIVVISRTNPGLLAYVQILGTFDFKSVPMAPLGTKSIVHEKPSQRETWIKHGVAGWYIGP